MLNKKDNISKITSKIIIALAMAIRVVLQLRLPIWGRPNWAVDDGLGVQYAINLLEGNWLGENYNSYALNKVPGYSFFLAFNDILGVPYMLTLGVFYCLACYIFLVAIRKVAKNEWISILCFLFLLFSPVMFDDQVAQKIYRLAIIPGLVIIMVSCYLVLYVERTRGIKRNLPWLILLSITIGWFSIVREDKIWFMCFVLGATVVLVGLYIIEHKKPKISNLLKYFVFLLAPVLSINITECALKTINYKHYGLYVTTDFNDTYFEKVYRLLLSIEPEEEIPKVLVSRNTFERATEVSPTLNLLHDNIISRFETPGIAGHLNGEFHGGFLAWHIRWAADDYGVYQSAENANNFYKQIYDELSVAFENGTFKKRDALIVGTFAKPLMDGDLEKIVKHSFMGYREIISYSDIEPHVYMASGSINQITEMTDIVNQTLLQSTNYNINGWMLSIEPDKDLEFIIYDDEGKEIKVEFTDSEDIYDYFIANGFYFETAKKCRFSVTINSGNMNINKLNARIYHGADLVYDGDIDNLVSFSCAGIHSHIEAFGVEDIEICMALDDAYKNVDSINSMISYYRKTWFFCMYLCFGCFYNRADYKYI